MPPDHTDLAEVIGNGGTLPDALLDMLKENAHKRSTTGPAARLQKSLQSLSEFARLREAFPLPPSRKRPQRPFLGMPRRSPAPGNDPPPLTCCPGWTAVTRSAPFSWGSSETPSFGPQVQGPFDAYQWSLMTRRHTGEFSLALQIDSDPASPWFPATSKGLGFNGVELSATIGQLFVPGTSTLVIQGAARLGLPESLSSAAEIFAGDVYSVAEGSATITVTEYQLRTGRIGSGYPMFVALGHASTSIDLFGWAHGPDGEAIRSSDPQDSGFLDLSATLAHHQAATFAAVEIDLDIFAAVRPSAPNDPSAALLYFDFRVDDPSLIVGPESPFPQSYNLPQPPYPSPFSLRELKLCSFP